MKEFSYYFDGVRQVRTDYEFLTKLTNGKKNKEGIIDGIKNSEMEFNKKQNKAP